MRQLTDKRMSDDLSQMDQEALHEYYLVLERRFVGANVVLFEHNKRPMWMLGMPEDDIGAAYEALHHRWQQVTRALDFADANALATTSRERREEIRNEVRAKLTPKVDTSAENGAGGDSESEQEQTRASADDVVHSERLSEAST